MFALFPAIPSDSHCAIHEPLVGYSSSWACADKPSRAGVDDILLVAPSFATAVVMIRELPQARLEAGWNIHVSKSGWTAVANDGTEHEHGITDLEGKPLEYIAPSTLLDQRCQRIVLLVRISTDAFQQGGGHKKL